MGGAGYSASASSGPATSGNESTQGTSNDFIVGGSGGSNGASVNVIVPWLVVGFALWAIFRK